MNEKKEFFLNIIIINNKYINTYSKNIVDDKIKAFEQSVIKNYNFEKTYELKNCILRNTL